MKKTFSDIQLVPATIADYPTIQNMAGFYVYDRTAFMGWECPESGLFECIDFKHYFETSNEEAYLIRVDNEIAGFVLLDKMALLEPVDWNMGEFFVLAKFQGKGIAFKVAQQIFNEHPGKWSVAVMPENLKAVKFWRKIITAVSQGKYTEVFKTEDELRTAENPDPYAMNVFSFETPRLEQSKDRKKPALDIQITKASVKQESVIAQLYELYTYEMTDLADFDIHDNGLYGYSELPTYWQDPNKYPHLIWVNKKLAGFVLVQKGSPITHDADVWDIAEFFIMCKFRKKSIGGFVAQEMFGQFKGPWQIRVWDNNSVAHAFWDNTITQFNKKTVIPTKQVYQGHDGLLVYKFHSPARN
ncbi:MAG: GNAT family N-acetyltransferase [Legionella sp.]|nr:GNAT family N-acetyltransferase [Legionella sp.]